MDKIILLFFYQTGIIIAMPKKCAIIGAGIAGIATALRLAAKGNKVEIFEANDHPGGKIKTFEHQGYRFDMGPSVFTLPELIDELFELYDKDPRQYFSYSQLENPFKYFFEDGTCINAYSDTNKFAGEIENKTSDSREDFYRYLKDIATKYDITNEVFIQNSLHIPTNFLTKKTISGILNFPKIHAFTTMNNLNKSFFKDHRLVQIFNNFATYVGSNPLVAPGTLNVIQHLELNCGMFMPDRGMYSIIEALVKLAKEAGIKFHLNTKVDSILIEKKTVTGINVNGKALPFDRVVSNMDIYFTYKRLLKNEPPPVKTLNQPKSSSVVVYYWCIKRTFPQLGIHNMFFSNNDPEVYRSVFDKKEIYANPSVYIFISNKHTKADAPAGCENWFVMVTAPHHDKQDWDAATAKVRKNVVGKINRMLSTDIEKYIEHEEMIHPEWIERNYSNAYGAIYGNSSNSRFAAFLRHPNFSKRIKGLYFAGGSVHPGAGIPMCLNSAKIVEKVFR